jgi:hypothetical protein
MAIDRVNDVRQFGGDHRQQQRGHRRRQAEHPADRTGPVHEQHAR